MTAPREVSYIDWASEALVQHALALNENAILNIANVENDLQALENAKTGLGKSIDMLKELRRRAGNQRRAAR